MFSGESETLLFPFFPPITFKSVLLHQMCRVKYCKNTVCSSFTFFIYIASMISQPVHGDSRLKLYLIYMADLHIQANHLLTVDMYPNWGFFFFLNLRNTWRHFFSHLDYCDSLCSSLQFLKRVSSQPYNSSKMLQQYLKEKWSLLQLPVSFRIDCWGFYFHGSAGYVPWLYRKDLCESK